MESHANTVDAILFLSSAETLRLLSSEGQSCLYQALQARGSERWTVCLVQPPFFTGATQRFQERIQQATSLRQRLDLRTALQGWMSDEVEPRLKACDAAYALARRPMPPVLSAAAWERFLVDLSRAFVSGFAQALGGQVFIRSSACLELPAATLAWRPLPAPGTKDGKHPRMFLPVNLLVHRYEAHAPPHVHESTHTLLPTNDLTVLQLVASAYPEATFLCAGHERELSPAVEALLPPTMCVQGLGLAPFSTAK